MAWWLIVLGISVAVLGISAFGLARRSKGSASSKSSGATPDDKEHRDAPPRSTAPGSPPMSPAPAGAPAPMAKSAPLNWNAVGALTGVLGLIVSIIGLFKG